MGENSGSLVFPTLEEIVEINLFHIATSGGICLGTDNLRNRSSLEWVLDTIQYPLFGVDRYPTLVEKAARLSWVISTRHVFHKGNKRTSTATLLTFLRVNGYGLEASNEELVETSLLIASRNEPGNSYDFEEYVEWIRARLKIMAPSGKNRI